MLAIENIHVSYGPITALQGISLNVPEGQIVAVIGPNGAGKSTLLLTIAGVVKPRSGSVVVAGQPVIGEVPEALVSRGIALVPEGRHIFGTLTVAENMALGATTRSDRGGIAEDIERLLQIFPVLRDRYRGLAGKLSGGEQQMLAIARALMSRPKLLLLDEPSLGLAPLVVRQVYQTIFDLKSQNLTVLIVEQNVNRALAAADHSHVMNSGRILLSGTSSSLYGSAEFDAAYFGAGAKARAR